MRDSAAISPSNSDLQGLEDVIDQTRDEWDIPGLATAVIKDGQVRLSQGFGKRSVSGNLDTRFRVHIPAPTL
ncbi:hypothetical protein KSB_02820 [Ktedonobacter robiniae]|uniref:Beta-lactamase-related domain-containing protein n=1 Tax=Ktedonobacter robiniae TaxID=2778365 RepID=A0ABQ3UH81_9CHLR|nr:hypothetical protein KSB_02820 [Ktedonobacter robiniae]